ncbi:Integrin beta-3, partial [Halocaridina rubra]
SCEIGKCQNFSEAVLCHFRPSEECDREGSLVDELPTDNKDKNVRVCTLVDNEDDCVIHFTYQYNGSTTNYTICILKEKNCPIKRLNVVLLGVICAVVAIGLLTLILWRIFATLQDRRELAKFEEERKRAQYNSEDNPLYRNPVRLFHNPSFSRPHH